MQKLAKTTLVDIYDAWRDHDLDRLATYLPNDFSHYLNIPVEMISVGGLRQGKAAAIERLGQIFDSFDTQCIEPGAINLDDIGASTDVQSHCLHRTSRTWLHTTKRHVWLIEDGWPVSLSEFYDLKEFEAFMRGAKAA
jgi:hypothetical protein